MIGTLERRWACQILDDSSAVISDQRYMPFGELREDVGTLLDDFETDDGYTDFGYTGQRAYMGQSGSPGFGLMDYNARFYSPSLGRFLQPDSIIPDLTNSQAWNRYSYVQNNPVMYRDASGHIMEHPSDTGPYFDGDHTPVEDLLAYDWYIGYALYYPDELKDNYVDYLAQDRAALIQWQNCSYGACHSGGDFDTTTCTICGGPMPETPYLDADDAVTAEMVTFVLWWAIGHAMAAVPVGGTQAAGGAEVSLFPETVARAIPISFFETATHLGPFSNDFAFVTGTSDLMGISNSTELARLLGLYTEYGMLLDDAYAVVTFETPPGIYFPPPGSYNNPYHIGYGLTIGGGREYGIPNLRLTDLDIIEISYYFRFPE